MLYVTQHYVRSGWVEPFTGQLKWAGFHGNGLSSWADSNNTRVYSLGFDNPDTHPSGSGNRFGGNPLRCLSTV